MLNSSQERAVNYRGRLLQIIAGPGTGKTFTLASRIEKVIQDGETTPEKILALTFTNNAVNELKTRLSNTFGSEVAERMRVMTYHAFGAYLISMNPGIVGLIPDGWDSADEWDQQMILLSLKGLKYGPKARLNKLRHIRMALKDSHDVSSAEREALAAYRSRLMTLQMIDYDTMLEMGAKIIESSHNDQLNVDHVFLDEFQDTSPLQWEIVAALIKKGEHRKLTAVGDPNQEIYQFMNHWKFGSFAAMDTDFPETEKIHLDINYRSSQEICDLAAEMINRSEQSPLKAVHGHNGCSPLLKLYNSDGDELLGLVTGLREYRQEHSPKTVAVLVRTNAEVDRFARALADANIPVDIFYNRTLLAQPYVQLMYTLFKHTTSPNDVHLCFLLTSKESRVFSHSQINIMRSHLGQQDFRKAAEGFLNKHPSRHRTKIRFEESLRVLDHAVEILRASSDLSVVREASIAVLSVITQRSPKFFSSGEVADFFRWIERSSQSRIDSEEPLVPWVARTLRNPFLPTTGSIDVQTIHSAKGQEWDAVFLPKAQVGTYPYSYHANAEQDRKLLFVGLTRARSHLFLSATGQESPFLDTCQSLARTKSPNLQESDFRLKYPRLYAPLPRISHHLLTARVLAFATKKLHI